MADAILNSKLSLMREYQIRTEVTAHVPAQMRITDTELCVLLGNLLDNAIEACQRVSEEEGRFIRIYMDTLQEQFYISVMNGMQGRAVRYGELFQSTKRGAGVHGFGLQRVDRIVRKYGGFLDRQSEDGVFATEVLLPIRWNLAWRMRRQLSSVWRIFQCLFWKTRGRMVYDRNECEWIRRKYRTVVVWTAGQCVW